MCCYSSFVGDKEDRANDVVYKMIDDEVAIA
jgi:hypothetical protein